MMNKQQRYKSLALLTAVALIAGCAPQRGLDAYFEKMQRDDPEQWARLERSEALRKSQETAVLSVSISCLHHGPGPYIQGFWVQEVPWGQMSIRMRGGDFNCGGQILGGYTLPLTWRPGMKVKVRWMTWLEGREIAHEKYTTIAYYPKAGDLWVHFFPNDEVRLVISDFYPESPNHPIVRSSVVPPAEVE